MNLRDRKFFKVKNPNKSFLCGAPRQMKYNRNLSFKNYLQLTTLAVGLMYFLFPVFGFKTIYLMFVIWVIAEVANKILYRNELPCPYCGFDATWYRRDVKVARRKVEDFWALRNPKQNLEGEVGENQQSLNKNNLNTENQSEAQSQM
jgi:hypothetical protein